MGRTADISGLKSGKLTVLAMHGYQLSGRAKRALCLCQCECGTRHIVMAQALKSGTIRSCGCAKTELGMATKDAHGMSGTRLHRIWTGLKQRCRPHYKNYGSRGISYCPGWKEFKNFRDWSLSNGYEDHLEIDRINNDGNYEPENCRWVSRAVNASNTRQSHRVSSRGSQTSVADIARDAGMNAETLWLRLSKQGLSLDEAIRKPAFRFRRSMNGGACVRGHAMTPENTYFAPSRPADPSCRECQKNPQQKEQGKTSRRDQDVHGALAGM